jgi:hypothetical protein
LVDGNSDLAYYTFGNMKNKRLKRETHLLGLAIANSAVSLPRMLPLLLR